MSPGAVSRRALVALVVGALAVSLGVAVLGAPRASSAPDGLERVAIDEGFDGEATEHALADSPAADYSSAGWRAGGVLLVFGAATGLAAVAVRRRRSATGVDA